MPFTHHKAQRDANHADIVAFYESQFVSVQDTSGVGGGFPDTVMAIPGVTDLVEIKTEEGDLRPNQKTFIRDWRGSVWVVRNHTEAARHIQDMRRRQKKL